MEYLFTLGLSLAALLAASVFFLGSTDDGADQNLLNEVTNIGRTVVDTAESVFYIGAGSKTTITVTVPKGVDSIAIWDKRDLVITTSTRFGVSELVFVSDVDLTPLSGGGEGNYVLPLIDEAGKKDVEIRSLGDNVTIGQI